MQYKQFEDLPVWRKAVELAVRVHSLSSTGSLKGYSGLRDQMERAALSISNNVAEGFERGTRDELITFLYIARGSAGEVRSMAHVCQRLLGDDEGLTHVADIHEMVTEVSRQLGGWIESLKNTAALNPRERTEAARRAASEAKRRDAFLSQLQSIARGDLEFSPEGNEPTP
jgi:four helix bundle protein